MAEDRKPEDLKESGDPNQGSPYTGAGPDPLAGVPNAPEDLRTGSDPAKGTSYTGKGPNPIPAPDDAPN